MPDMLVKLYGLPEVTTLVAQLRGQDVDIRRAIAPEKHVVVDWVRRAFGASWASECEVAFANRPVSCFVAVERESIVGFACHDATAKDFFGPMGVVGSHRGRKIGKALLLACLHAMSSQGYAYAIIGGAGPAEFYTKTVGALEIAGSDPGVYRGMLRARGSSGSSRVARSHVSR